MHSGAMTSQMDLFAAPIDWRERLPAWFGNDFLGPSEDADSHFPVEQLPEVTTKAGKYQVSLRAIEDGVWLWGVSADWKVGGFGFAPLRKWGPQHAAMSRAEALEAATSYAVAKLEASR